MRRFKRDAKNEKGRLLVLAPKEGDEATPEATSEPSFEGAASDRTFSRREAVGLTGAALAGFAALAATNASAAVADTAGSEVTSARGTAAKPKVSVQEAKIVQPALEGVGSLLKHRHYWGKLNGQRILTLTSPVFRRSQQVYVSIHEGFFIGAARYTVHNVAPTDGAILVWINIEWGSPIDLFVDYLIVG
jgi:hypothetical protein